MLLLILSLLIPVNANAASLISKSDPYNTIKSGPSYHSGNDEIRFELYGTSTTRIYYEYYHDSGFSEAGTKRTINSASGYWYVAFGLNCVGWYKVTGYSASGSELFNVKVQVNDGDLQSPACLSGGDRDDLQQDTPVNPNPTECAELVCECIAELEQPIDNVGAAVKENGKKLDTANGHLTDIKQVSKEIKQSVVDFHDEFKTDKNYNVKSPPNVSDMLDKNKPSQPDKSFKDDNVYFKDEGNASESPGKLPKAPEPKDWDGVQRDNDLSKEDELQKDKFDRDSELEKDKYSKDDELQKDKFERDSEYGKDSEMKKDSFNKDNEMQKDSFSKDSEMEKDSFTRDSIPSQSDELDQTLYFEQTNIMD